MSTGAAAAASAIRNNRRSSSVRNMDGSRSGAGRRDSQRSSFVDHTQLASASDNGGADAVASISSNGDNAVSDLLVRRKERGSLGSIPDENGSVGNDSGDCSEGGIDEVAGWRLVVRRFNKGRVLCGRIVNDQRVQMIMVVLIAANAILMGVGTFDFVTDDPAIEARFEAIDQIFLIVFTVELSMQLVYHGLRLFMDGWLVFDFVVIVMSWAFAQAQIIRAFRIFRALRLITRVAVMRNLVTALFSVMPRMAAIALLLLLLMYIFAVMFTQLFKYMYRDGLTEYDYFSQLGATFFTLFQIMTMDAWADVARDVMETYPWAWLPFIIFVIISGFIVVNLIIAVICDAIAALHDDERAALTGRKMDEEDEEGEVEGAGDEDGDSACSERSQQSDIEELENQIEELTKIQQQTLMTLDLLTQKLKESTAAKAKAKAPQVRISQE